MSLVIKEMANQIHNEMLLHTHQDGDNKKPDKIIHFEAVEKLELF